MSSFPPPHQPVAAGIIAGLGRVMRKLHQLPTAQLGRPLADLDPSNTAGFAHVLIDHLARFAAWARPWAAPARVALAIPADPIAPLRAYADTMTSRMATLIHVDIHRRSAIVRPDGTLVLIDWEFAVIGDPVYDLARHLYMIRYASAEVNALLAAYAPHTHPTCLHLLHSQAER